MKLTVQFNVEVEIESAAVAQATLTAINDGIQANTPEGVIVEIASAKAEVVQNFDLMDKPEEDYQGQQ